MWGKTDLELDHFILTFGSVADRRVAAWRLLQQHARIEVRDVGEKRELLQLHVWLPKMRSAGPFAEQVTSDGLPSLGQH